MTNEAVILELYGQPSGEPIRFSVCNEAGIEKGTLLAISGADLYAYKDTANPTTAKFAGIAATEKVANDGSTTLGLYTKGIFDVVASGVIAIGELVGLSGGCVRTSLPGDLSGGCVVGKALETSSVGEVIRVKVGSII